MAKKRILIVEDDEGMREIYQDIFTSQQDYEIDQVTNAEHGLIKAEREDYALIILDIIMEPMTGDSFFVRLRDNPKTAELPVLVISVLSPETLARLKEIDHCSIMQKPVKKAELLNKIGQMIG